MCRTCMKRPGWPRSWNLESVLCFSSCSWWDFRQLLGLSKPQSLLLGNVIVHLSLQSRMHVGPGSFCVGPGRQEFGGSEEGISFLSYIESPQLMMVWLTIFLPWQKICTFSRDCTLNLKFALSWASDMQSDPLLWCWAAAPVHPRDLEGQQPYTDHRSVFHFQDSHQSITWDSQHFTIK